MGISGLSGPGSQTVDSAGQYRQAEGSLPQQGPAHEVRSRGEREQGVSLIEAMQRAREQAQERREQLKLPKDTRYGEAAMEAYIRLNRARTPAQAGAAGNYARRQIARLQTAKRQDPDHARQIQAAIAQLQKATRRSGKKKRELEQERLSELRREKLLQEEQRQRAQRLHLQLQRGRTMRMLRERAYLREAEIDSRLQAQMAQTQAELAQQAANFSDAAIAQYVAQLPPPTAPASGEISVQV